MGEKEQPASAGGLLADDRAVAAPIPVEPAVARSIGEHPDPDSRTLFQELSDGEVESSLERV